MFVYYLKRAEATSRISDTNTPDSSQERTESFFSYNVEFYLPKPELEEYPKTDLTEAVEIPLDSDMSRQTPVYENADVLPDNVEVIASSLPARERCSCVFGARYFSKIDVGFMSDFGPGVGARNHPGNIAYPAVGAIVVTSESDWGHVATITAVSPDFTYFDVIETNYVRCGVTTRRIYTNDPKILRYYWQYVPNN